MKYFERCKKRIECAVKIFWADSYSFNHIQQFTIDEVLVIKKICEIDFVILYSAHYKKISIPMSQEECETLFNFANKKHRELEIIEENKILEEL